MAKWKLATAKDWNNNTDVIFFNGMDRRDEKYQKWIAGRRRIEASWDIKLRWHGDVWQKWIPHPPAISSTPFLSSPLRPVFRGKRIGMYACQLDPQPWHTVNPELIFIFYPLTSSNIKTRVGSYSSSFWYYWETPGCILRSAHSVLIGSLWSTPVVTSLTCTWLIVSWTMFVLGVKEDRYSWLTFLHFVLAVASLDYASMLQRTNFNLAFIEDYVLRVSGKTVSM
jgi:hypothetical protein